MNRSHLHRPARAVGFVIVLVGLTGFVRGAVAQDGERDKVGQHFRVVRAIETAPLEREELVAVSLDSAVFQEGQPSFADLRIDGPAGTWNSFVVQTRRGARERRVEWTDAARNVSLRPLPEGQGIEIRFTGDPKRKEAPTELRIVTGLKDFEQRVRVYDDETGAVLRDDAVIFDYSRYIDFRDAAIPLPAGEHRRFRLVIDAPTSEQASQLKELSKTFRGGVEETVEERRAVLDRPFRIDRVELRGTLIASDGAYDLETEYPVLKMRTEEDRERRETVVTFEAHRTPASRLELEIDGKNFSRSATVETETERNGQTEWTAVGTATLTRFDFRGEKKEQRNIPLQGGRYAKLRVRIANRDNSPLSVTGVRLIGPEYEAVFLGEPRTAYRMHYGADVSGAPDYDVAAIRAALGTSARPVMGKLGAVQPGTAPVGGPPPKRVNLWNDPLVLGAIIVALMALLGFGLMHAGRAVSALPADEDGSAGKE